MFQLNCTYNDNYEMTMYLLSFPAEGRSEEHSKDYETQEFYQAKKFIVHKPARHCHFELNNILEC